MRNIAAWLSEHSKIGSSMGSLIFPLKDLSHAACHLVLASSTYSVSPTDNVTIFCHWNAQDIALLAIRKMCPDVEWQSSLFSPQSESEYLINPASEAPSYLILSSLVPLRYQSTYLAYLMCSSVGLLLNRDNLIATNCWNRISGDVIPTWNRTFRLGIVSDHCAVKTCANDIILTADW